jgi:hypothetical protein
MTLSTALLIASSLISLASLLVHAFAPKPVSLRVSFRKGRPPLAAPQTMTADGTLNASVSLLDKKGRTMVPPAPPVWTSSAPAVASTLADADGVHATIEGEGPGDAVVTVTCAGLTETTPFVLTPAVPASLAVTFGSPP